MMKFRFRRQGNDPQREKIKQDLFAFNKTVEHGFPNHPSALAYDPKLRLMAIGTKSGAVKIYGAPGVEFTGLHKETATVTQMHFLPGQGRLLSLLDDNTLHLWELNLREGRSQLEEVHSFTLPGRPGHESTSATRLTVILLKRSCDVACLGTEGGGVHFLELPSLRLLDSKSLFQDEIMQSVPEDYKSGKSLGPVESLQEHPQSPNKVLIGYSRGLVVLWDQSTRQVDGLFLGNQLESLGWERSGKTLVSSHSDGGYMVWAVNGGGGGLRTQQPVTSIIPYGPFPCKAINKILWRTTESGAPFVLFSGGMPRASYGDRHCVTVLQETTQVTLDFTSRVIDFFTIHNTDVDKEYDDPTALVVLLEEELVVIDLQTSGWPTVPSPYLAPLHSSAITCSYHISNVPTKLWEKIIGAGQQQSPPQTHMKWPINGGKNLAPEPKHKGLLLTGHEDGTVRFWDASGVSLKPLYKLSTANIFQTDCDHNDSLTQSGEEEWPPFRKVGCFDPYSDDPRLGIQKISLCKYSGRLVVAGTAGQVLVMELNEDKSDHGINSAAVDLLQDREGFTWKGHDRLAPKNGPISFPPGFQPLVLVQCMPPAAVTAVTLHAEWNLIAFGTSHGFGLFDYQRRSPVLARCTLHPNDSLVMEGPLSRVKSLKKSLRQSFRRIRKSRVSGKKRVAINSPTSKVQEANAQLAEQAGPHDVEVAPVQRRIEPRSADDSLSGVVRCLCFADTYLRDGTHHGPTMWAGTNSGSVYAYALEVPSQDRFSEQSVEAVLGKEIQLMHRAPVVSIAVLDGQGNPLPEPYEVSRDLAKAPDMQGSHSVLIASEEQFKVFTLPKVSAKTKFKLTAHEGCRVRKVALASFGSVASDEYSENGLACLTNLGDIHVFSVPALRPQVRYDCIRKEDISGIASCVFTKMGQGFYLISPSEFERFSLSARVITEPVCSVELDRPHSSPPLGNSTTGSLQANGTHKLQTASDSHSLGEAEGGRARRRVMENALLTDSRVLEEIQAALSSPALDSPNSSADITLDTTGDITVEDVKDFLVSAEEAEKNLKNISDDDARSPEILIK
ncbi:lethal(2) giant larvae protein homolog 1 isoform X2 [Lepisosteus oculatus]|uniref:lethal(2) giant larvae protein homolog 1 isoform X2 n=1 Tax=Lepisosteus oculatus TaxID=7918 RepID=UPI00073FB7B5|nr:PREDICTED: lethal(2) giant larvae protein homolog 1 isoform X2 [Lepisosteus oculatus]